MPDAAAWQAFAGVVTVLIFLGGGWRALKHFGLIGNAAPAPAPASDPPPAADIAALAERVRKLEKDLQAFQLHVAEQYVHRSDFVPNESRLFGILEKHSAILIRIEDRTGRAANAR